MRSRRRRQSWVANSETIPYRMYRVRRLRPVDGGEPVAFAPVLFPGTSTRADPLLRKHQNPWGPTAKPSSV